MPAFTILFAINYLYEYMNNFITIILQIYIYLGSRRSRSAPARSDSEGKKSPSSKAWVDTRQIQKIKEEPFEIKSYNMDDVERLGRRRQDELQVCNFLQKFLFK